VRASDGLELWNSDDTTELRGLTIASNPAVVGRYTYAIGVDPGAQTDRLVMLALDVTSGAVLWRTDCGTIAKRANITRFNRPLDPVIDVPDPWQNLSPPAVVGGLVVIVPNAGCVIAVGRFDGRLQWLRSYETAPSAAAGRGDNRQRRAKPARTLGVSTRTGAMRFTSTPQILDGLVIVAPLDSDSVFAFDARSGKSDWRTEDLASATLIGTSENGSLIFADRALVAIGAKNGEVRWTWNGPATGPAVMHGQTILVPTADEVSVINASSGAVIKGPQREQADFAVILRSQAAREALGAAGVLGSFVPESDDPQSDK
jgi:outer membrane protein assembly factor BamB